MTLGFSTKHNDGSPTKFEEKILLPFNDTLGRINPKMRPKIHTFRLGYRWRAGLRMHMVVGNRTAQRRQFNLGIPDLEYCKSVQTCVITCAKDPMPHFVINIGHRILTPEEEIEFMYNDGFENLDQMWNWFAPNFRGIDKIHLGQLIHFSDLKY